MPEESADRRNDSPRTRRMREVRRSQEDLAERRISPMWTAVRQDCAVPFMMPGRVNDSILKATGASGVVHKGNGVQVIYGPNVTVIKSNLEDYLEKAPDTYAETEAAKAEETEVQPQESTGTEGNRDHYRMLSDHRSGS